MMQLDHDQQQKESFRNQPCIVSTSSVKCTSYLGFKFSYQKISPLNADPIPALFVSGAFQSMQSWHRFAKYFLARGKSVIMVDLPGTGDSDPLPCSYGQDYLADAIKLMLDEAGVERVSVISASYGTPTAFCFAQAYPHKVESLILCGTMREIPDYVKDGLSHTLITLRSGNIKEFAKEVLGITGPYKGQGLLCTDPKRQISKHRVAMRLLYGQLISMTPLERIKYELNTLRLIKHGSIDINQAPACNTLIFTGEHDCFTLPSYGKEMASRLPNSNFTTVRNSDHLVHIEQFRTTAELIHNFSYGLPIDCVPNLNAIEYVGTDPMECRNTAKSDISSSNMKRNFSLLSQHHPTKFAA